MTLPTTYLAALLAVILGALCLGSWINTLKLAKKWRFELFCFDFAIGAFLAACVAAATLGTLGADGFTLLDDLMRLALRAGIDSIREQPPRVVALLSRALQRHVGIRAE